MFTWGMGFRSQHFWHWMEQSERPLFELLSDNYLYQTGGPALEQLRTLSAERPPLLHGVGLNIGGIDPIDRGYVRRLRQLADLTRSSIISDHLCFCRGRGIETFDLLPIPYTVSELNRVSDRVHAVQDALGQRLTLENISAYVAFRVSGMTEMEFLSELVARTGCSLLLDVNNLYVSCHNLGLDLERELAQIDPSVISYFHISGHSHRGSCLYDSHDQKVIDPVMAVLEHFAGKVNHGPVVLERDDPDLAFVELLAEWKRLQNVPLRVNDQPFVPSGRPSRSSIRRTQPILHADPALQDQIMQELLRNLGMVEGQSTAADWLTDATVSCWPLYVHGLVGRWTALVETSFRRAVCLWGKDLVAQVLFEYARENPPRTADTTRAFAGLPTFVRHHIEFQQIKGLADFLEACSLYWELLEGEDPKAKPAGEPALQHYLQHPAKLFMPSEVDYDLFRLWQRSVDERYSVNDETDWNDPGQSQRYLLFVKSSTRSVSVLPVESRMIGFYQSLVEGGNLETAIGQLASQGPMHESQLESQLAAHLKTLVSEGLLVESLEMSRISSTPN